MAFENLLGKAESVVDEVTGMASNGQQGVAFAKDFNVSDFDSFGGSTTKGKFTEIARFKVPASTKYAWGYGAANNPDNQGYIYVDLQTSDEDEVEGTLQLVVQSATTRETEVVKELDTSRLDESKTDRKQMVPLPEQVGSALATQDSYLVLKLDPATSDTDVDDGTNSEVIIPVTEYDLSRAK